ncbi:hypothetical protein R3P38DRAFT_3212275 [Favolaschia claudopus]|uniref:Uncharacterized protein n=1 Tax=Favolaschia claudopus TaxID=2862362 RepID=A0AAW0ADL4_9AGAR
MPAHGFSRFLHHLRVPAGSLQRNKTIFLTSQTYVLDSGIARTLPWASKSTFWLPALKDLGEGEAENAEVETSRIVYFARVIPPPHVPAPAPALHTPLYLYQRRTHPPCRRIPPSAVPASTPATAHHAAHRTHRHPRNRAPRRRVSSPTAAFAPEPVQNAVYPPPHLHTRSGSALYTRTHRSTHYPRTHIRAAYAAVPHPNPPAHAAYPRRCAPHRTRAHPSLFRPHAHPPPHPPPYPRAPPLYPYPKRHSA